MANFTVNESKIIFALLDNEGHPNWELEERLWMKSSNLSRTLKDLREKNIVCYKSRPTTKYHNDRKEKSLGYSEKVWFIKQEIEVLNILINSFLNKDNMFALPKLQEIANSAYFRLMVEKPGGKKAKKEVARLYNELTQLDESSLRHDRFWQMFFSKK